MAKFPKLNKSGGVEVENIQNKMGVKRANMFPELKKYIVRKKQGFKYTIIGYFEKQQKRMKIIMLRS